MCAAIPIRRSRDVSGSVIPRLALRPYISVRLCNDKPDRPQRAETRLRSSPKSLSRFFVHCHKQPFHADFELRNGTQNKRARADERSSVQLPCYQFSSALCFMHFQLQLVGSCFPIPSCRVVMETLHHFSTSVQVIIAFFHLSVYRLVFAAVMAMLVLFCFQKRCHGRGICTCVLNSSKGPVLLVFASCFKMILLSAVLFQSDL